MVVIIRPERENDVLAIREVTVQAFSASEFGHNGEADLVEQLRANFGEILSLVAEHDQQVVGHILFSPVILSAVEYSCNGMGLAPLAVLPGFQNQGIGSRLVEAGLSQLAEEQSPFVVVLGHPKFYARFGFEIASDLGIASEFAGLPAEVFRIKRLSIRPEELPQGNVKYRPEFQAF